MMLQDGQEFFVLFIEHFDLVNGDNQNEKPQQRIQSQALSHSRYVLGKAGVEALFKVIRPDLEDRLTLHGGSLGQGL